MVEKTRRSGDILHPDFLYGKPGSFNVTVRNSSQSKYVVVAAARKAGAAAEAGECETDKRHDEEVTSAGGCFYPMVLWSPASLKILRIIASKTTCSMTSFVQAL